MSRAGAGAARSAHPDGKRAILLVNDDPSALFALRTVLGDLEAEIVSAVSGEQALLRRDFSVILMDVKMRGMDGFEAARLIRADPQLAACR